VFSLNGRPSLFLRNFPLGSWSRWEVLQSLVVNNNVLDLLSLFFFWWWRGGWLVP